jgi:hypothetical protein
LGAGSLLLLGGVCVALIAAVVAYQSGMFAGLFPPAQPAATLPASSEQAPTQLPNETAPASAETPAPLGAVLFSDNFSSRENGWPQGPSGGAQYRYQGGAYRATAGQVDTLYWATPEGTFDDASLSVEASRAAGGGMSYFGLLCRIQDDENFYYLVVRSDGYFTIGKYLDAAFIGLMPAGWTYSGALADADEPYRLRADCAGDRLSLYLGDKKLGEAQDGDFTAGRVGLALAAIGQGQRLEVIFDEFVVREINP